VLDFLRKKNSRYNYEIADITQQQYMFVDNSSTAEEEIVNKEILQKVYRCINSLKPKYKEVIFLRYVEGLNISEIAEILGITVSNVKVRLHRAIKVIKKEIEIL